MTAKINKTNAARLLDKAKIAYELVPYEVDENNLAATHVAEQLGENIAQVFKTLVLRGDKNGLFVCVVPGDAEVDLKLAAKVSGNKSAAMIHMKELLPYIKMQSIADILCITTEIKQARYHECQNILFLRNKFYCFHNFAF